MRVWAHGRSGYVNHGCRCDACKRGNAKAMQRYNLIRKTRGICRACARDVDPGNQTYCARHRALERERQARGRLGVRQMAETKVGPTVACECVDCGHVHLRRRAWDTFSLGECKECGGELRPQVKTQALRADAKAKRELAEQEVA